MRPSLPLRLPAAQRTSQGFAAPAGSDAGPQEARPRTAVDATANGRLGRAHPAAEVARPRPASTVTTRRVAVSANVAVSPLLLGGGEVSISKPKLGLPAAPSPQADHNTALIESMSKAWEEKGLRPRSASPRSESTPSPPLLLYGTEGADADDSLWLSEASLVSELEGQGQRLSRLSAPHTKSTGSFPFEPTDFLDLSKRCDKCVPCAVYMHTLLMTCDARRCGVLHVRLCRWALLRLCMSDIVVCPPQHACTS